MYRKSVVISLVLVYMVVIAGAVVRMTGSGMGCPDWPKCFGYIIPPTQESELLWQPDKTYKKGQVIIVDETLQVANSDFTTGDVYTNENWSKYAKHDYAIFNPLHTWVEYANRLIGALAGFAVLIMAILSIRFWKKSKRIPILAWFTVFLMGLQGWIGATVVYSVLSPVRITIHMIIALVIVALLMYLLFLNKSPKHIFSFDSKFKTGMWLALFLTLVQIAMGTQVRQFVDDQVDLVGYGAKSLWLANPDLAFYFHRSFSIIVLAINIWLYLRNKRFNLGHKLINWVMVLIGVEIITGICMYYFDFPFLTQPLHLILASILFGLQFYILLTAFKEKSREQLTTVS
ncbi:MAG: COX15/CtaA family protein [Leeuwenhoekiella sp.]